MFEMLQNIEWQKYLPILYAIIFVGCIGLLAWFFTYKGNTMPVGIVPSVTKTEGFTNGIGAEGFTNGIGAAQGNNVAEGFYGGAANGAGEPSCLRTLSDAAAVYDVVASKAAGSQDLAEFKLLLSKWACLKKDLMSPSGIVDATRQLPYSTLHDRIPVPDLAGQCNAKSVPLRDLDITFDTWKRRATYLFRRLAAGLNSNDVASLEERLMKSWADVYDVAKSQCIGSVPAGKMNPRDAAPMTPTELVDLGT